MDVLKHQVDDALLAKGFFEIDYALMLEHFEQFYFAHCGLAHYLIFLGFLELLNGHDLFVFVAAAFEDDTIGALPYHPHNIVLLHYQLSYNLTTTIHPPSSNFMVKL